MKVILKKEIPKVGAIGEIKEVRPGYARNYLIPRGYAQVATDGVLKAWAASESRRKKRIEQEKESIKKLAEKISSTTISFSKPVSEDGNLFGSVAKSDILKNLKTVNININKEAIKLPSSIKSVGNFEVEISLQYGIKAKLKIVVTAQNK